MKRTAILVLVLAAIAGGAYYLFTAGPDVYSQTTQILRSFNVMLESVGSDLHHVVHVNVFLKDMQDFERMNQAYVEKMGDHRPARTVIGVHELPKPGVLLTMNLTAVTKEQASSR